MTMEETVYDVCVVGAGMVGSAAAKWLCKLQRETKVCLVGPQEPTKEEWSKREIFSAHYDEGRLTREMDEDLIWATLAQRSIKQFRDIERESGIRIYQEVGCAFVGIQGEDSLQITKENAEKTGVTAYKALDSVGLREQLPYLHIEPNWEFLLNTENAGYVSPRNLVAAQQKIASSHGCQIIDDVVIKVEDTDGDFLKVLCQSGRQVTAKRVLLCTGAFSNYYDLLPGDKKIDFKPMKIFVVKSEVSEEYAKSHADMPCMIINIPGKLSYILPPIKYPDGKYYVKIGGYKVINVASGLEDMVEWFRNEAHHEDDKDTILNILKFFLPDLAPISVRTARCAISRTTTGMLYCDMISTRLGVVMGLTGKGAKSSDEIGRMAAKMVAKGSWDYDLPAEHFKLRFKST
ncbi:monomeric sarcosine oxidase-like isoform X1 [Lytechinus pictus]|uniref:monomeric sarcosine oxidase-like isoform X1 n=2 Tax=Lytechinus pictus TaxID=7653 RepID=UPI0030B9D3E5